MSVSKEQATRRQHPQKKGAKQVDWNAARPTATGGAVCWGDADGALLVKVTDLATRAGMAVSLSATSNGTGVSVTILDGPDRPKWYANTPEQLDQLLNMLWDILA